MGDSSKGARERQEPYFTPRLQLQTAGQSALAHLILAKTLFQNGRHGQALAELNAALNDNPELAAAHFLKGILLALRADFAGAAETLGYAVRLDPEEGNAWLALAYVEDELGQPERALRALDRCLQCDPGERDSLEHQVHLLRGNVLARLKRTDEAIAACRRALQVNPQLTQARFKLGRLLAERGDTEEAIRQILIAQRMNPTNPNTRAALGDLLRQLGRYDEAVLEYKATIDLRPAHSLGYALLGATYLEMGLVVEATFMLQMAIRLNPKDVDSLLNLGRIHLEQAHLAEAIELFEAALKVDPRYPETRPWLEKAQQQKAGGA